jgi:hypothetical protein
MKRVMAPLTIAACTLLPSAGTALAGQPGTNAGVNCGTISATGQDATRTPGNSGSSTNTGSPFAGGKSGSVYANAYNGSPPSTNPNAKSPLTATSQYDIACFNVTTKSNQPP